MTAAVQVKHLLLDVDFFEKPKIVALRYRHGAAFLLLYIEILCLMCKGTDAEIDEDCIRAIGEKDGHEVVKIDEFIAYCVERGLLERGSKPYLLFNRRVRQDQQGMAEKQTRWRDKKRAQRGHEGMSPGTNGGHLGDKNGTLNIELLNNEELNTEGSKDLKKNARAFTPTGKYDTPTIRKFLPLLQEKLARVNRGFGEIEWEALAMRLGCDVQRIEAAIIHTCSLTEPRNVCEPDNRARGSPPKSDANIERIKDFLAGASNGSGAGSEVDELSRVGVRPTIRALK